LYSAEAKMPFSVCKKQANIWLKVVNLDKVSFPQKFSRKVSGISVLGDEFKFLQKSVAKTFAKTFTFGKMYKNVISCKSFRKYVPFFVHVTCDNFCFVL
jgi:hypothetical protein